MLPAKSFGQILKNLASPENSGLELFRTIPKRKRPSPRGPEMKRRNRYFFFFFAAFFFIGIVLSSLNFLPFVYRFFRCAAINRAASLPNARYWGRNVTLSTSF